MLTEIDADPDPGADHRLAVDPPSAKELRLFGLEAGLLASPMRPADREPERAEIPVQGDAVLVLPGPATDADRQARSAFYPLRRLEAEVLIDALCQITGTTEHFSIETSHD